MQKVLAGMVDRGAHICFVDCPLYALDGGSLDNMNYWVMIHTNVDSEPSETAESFELKRSIHAMPFQNMQFPERQRAIINIDDPHAQEFLDASSKVPVVTYAVDRPEADVYAEKVSYTIWESELLIATPVGKIQLITPLIGKHHVYNILAAVATAVTLKLDLTAIVTGVEALDFVPGRYSHVC